MVASEHRQLGMIRSQHVIAIYLCPIFLLLLTDHRSLKIGPPPSPGTHSDGKQGENVERQTSMACVKCIELETIFSYLVWSSSSPVATAILKRASHDWQSNQQEYWTAAGEGSPHQI